MKQSKKRREEGAEPAEEAEAAQEPAQEPAEGAQAEEWETAEGAQAEAPEEAQAEEAAEAGTEQGGTGTVSAEELEKALSAAGQYRAEAEKSKAAAEEYRRKWYSVTAEYDNYRKRTQATASQKYTEGRADIVVKLFPVGDNIDRALAVCTDEKMRQGLEMVKASFEKILTDEGIEAFDPTGEEFDSSTSAAIAAQPAAEGEAEGIVKQTFLKGYRKGTKILRFAQVIVTR